MVVFIQFLKLCSCQLQSSSDGTLTLILDTQSCAVDKGFIYESDNMSYSISLLHSVLHYLSEDLTFPLTEMKGAEEVM